MKPLFFPLLLILNCPVIPVILIGPLILIGPSAVLIGPLLKIRKLLSHSHTFHQA